MRLIDLRRSAALRLRRGPPEEAGSSLEMDDLLSRGSDGLGLDVDSDGRLVLSEGVDFD